MNIEIENQNVVNLEVEGSSEVNYETSSDSVDIEIGNPSSINLEIGSSSGIDYEIGKNKNSTNYNSLTDKPKINGVELVGDKTTEDLKIVFPKKISELENDKKYATEDYVDNELATFDFIKVVDSLPTTGLPNKIYLVPKKDTQTQDLFDEYIWINNDWEYQGTKQIEVDLTPYAKKEDIPDVSNFVEDEDYVHTDNNFTDEDKEKLDGLENFSGNAVDISYEDNLGNGVDNTQDALDEVFRNIESMNTTINNLSEDISNNSAIIDLGVIDIDEYDGSCLRVMDTLTETGTYKFIDSYDEFIWYVEVYNLGTSIGQTYFNTEEGYEFQYSRVGYSDGEGGYDWQEWVYGEKASNIQYEDNYDNGVSDVQEAIDVLFAEMIGLREMNVIGSYHNATVTLASLSVGIYYLTGTNTQIRYASNKTYQNLITSDNQKLVLIALGTNGTYGKGIIFTGTTSPTQILMYVFNQGTVNNFSLSNLTTSSRDEKVSGTWTFNKLPITTIVPTAYNQLVNKRYVDNMFTNTKYATNLGYIDLDEYDGDITAFMDTIIEEGRYKFIDSYDEFEWYVEVYRTDNYAGQSYWGSEEGFHNKFYRHGLYNSEEDTIEWMGWNNYLTYDMANSMFASTGHTHYSSVSANDIRNWLDTQIPNMYREYEVIASNKHKYRVEMNYNVYSLNGKTNYKLYQEYYDMEEPNKIYKRTGTKSNNTATATVTWGDWYVFEGYVE